MAQTEKMSTSRGEEALSYFMEGYNCSQAVILAFADLFPYEKEELVKMVGPFGGGMGRLREVCGALTSCFLVLGQLYGYETPDTGEKKMELYARVQELGHTFEEKNGSMICRELLNLTVKHESPVPDARTAEFYQKRPCARLVKQAADMLEEYICQCDKQ